MAGKSVCLTTASVFLWLITMSIPAGAQMWTQTDWSGGPGQLSWSDSTMYYSGNFVDGWVAEGDLRLHANDSDWVNTGNLAGADGVYSLIEASDGALYAGTSHNGDAFKSIDAGTTWVNTGELAAAIGVYSLLEASDGALYATTYCTDDTGRVFRSIDAGTIWVNTGELSGATEVLSLIEGSEGVLYAGTYAGFASGGDVFKSVDAGTTWANTGDLAGTIAVTSLLEASDGALYAGTRPDGNVFKSVDAGTTWVNTGDLAGATCVSSLIETSDGVLYAGTQISGDVFKSTDAGTTWFNTGGLVGASSVYSLIEASDGALYAGIWPNGDVFRAGYFLAGDIVSSVYNIGSANVTYGTMTWNETLNDQTIYMLVRTDTLPDMSTAMDWDTCPPVVNGQNISDLASVDDFERYIQYRAGLVTTRSDVTPVLHEVSIQYELVGVEEGLAGDMLANFYQLLQNEPNPSSGRTVISYCLPSATHVILGVYDLSGRLVETLVSEAKGPGIHRASWNAEGRPAGLYFCRLRAGGSEYTRKMVIID